MTLSSDALRDWYLRPSTPFERVTVVRVARVTMLLQTSLLVVVVIVAAAFVHDAEADQLFDLGDG